VITLDTNLAARNATTQYSDFDYNSMVKFGNGYLCASENGLYELGGTHDLFPEDASVVEIIESWFELATLDFGLSNQKRLRAVYIGYESDGGLTLTISTELGISDSYTIPASTAGQHARRVIISRKLKGRYWTFKIYGSGVTFSIDEIKVLPVIRGHGFDQN